MSVATLSIHEIVIQRKFDAQDTTGGPTEDWIDYISTPARVQPLNGAERNAYMRTLGVVSHKVYVPGAPDIEGTDRMVFKGQVYVIRDVYSSNEIELFLTMIVELQK